MNNLSLKCFYFKLLQYQRINALLIIFFYHQKTNFRLFHFNLLYYFLSLKKNYFKKCFKSFVFYFYQKSDRMSYLLAQLNLCLMRIAYFVCFFILYRRNSSCLNFFILHLKLFSMNFLITFNKFGLLYLNRFNFHVIYLCFKNYLSELNHNFQSLNLILFDINKNYF